MSWPCTHIEEYAYIRLTRTPQHSCREKYSAGLPYLQQRSKGVEEPAVTVDLLLILLLHTEDDLRRYDALVGIFEVQIRVDRE